MSFPFRALRRPLDARARRAVEVRVAALVDWLGSLSRWPAPRATGLPDATPFVSIYRGGALAGCYGSSVGDPAERLARAFLSAAHDGRYAVKASARDAWAVEVAYPIAPVRVKLERATSTLEPGHHGVAHVGGPTGPVLVLPSVARDGALDARGLLELVARKAGVRPAELERGELWACSIESLVVRGRESGRGRAENAEDAARDWLASRIDSHGQVEAGCDPRTGAHFERTAFHHGRAAIVLQALSEHGGAERAALRGRRWLAREAKQALAGRSVRAWPEQPAEVAGTLALATMAGVDLRRPLAEYARRADVRDVPWHGAQVVAALGDDAPRELWRACVADLDAHPWAPWTAMAARRRGDGAALERAERALVESIRARPPFEGGADVRAIPELALTAVVVEALAGSPEQSARAAIRRAAGFLRRWQILAEPVPGAYRPELARGGFPLSPVMPQQRADVTAHALRALRIAAET